MTTKDIEEYEKRKSENIRSKKLSLLGALISICIIIYLTLDLLKININFGEIKITTLLALFNSANTSSQILINAIAGFGFTMVIYFIYRDNFR